MYHREEQDTKCSGPVLRLLVGVCFLGEGSHRVALLRPGHDSERGPAVAGRGRGVYRAAT